MRKRHPRIRAAAVLELRRRNRARPCEESFYTFVKHGWEHVDSNEFCDSWYVEEICNHLQAVYEKKINNLVINIPPGYGKSLLSSVFFPAWCWIKNPSLRLLTGSKVEDLAIRDCRKSRILLNSEWYRDLWGHLWKFCKDENAKSSYENDKGGFRSTFSSEGNVTGFRGDLRIFDDPHDAKDSYNKKELQKVCSWFKSVFSTRVDQFKISQTVIIMQRLSKLDLTGFILTEQKDLWTHLCLPLEYEPERKCVTTIGGDRRTTAGEILNKNVTNVKNLENLKTTLGTNDYAGQCQQRPNQLEGNIFKTSWFMRYNAQELPKLDYILPSLDTGWKVKDESSYSVMTVWGVRDKKIFLLYLWRDKVEFPALKRKCIEVWEKFLDFKPSTPLYHMLIEDKAAGVSIIQELRAEGKVNIKEIKPTEDKVVRAHAITPLVEAERVFIPGNRCDISDICVDVDIFLDEMLSFPKSEHNDIVDSSTQAWNFINSNSYSLADFNNYRW